MKEIDWSKAPEGYDFALSTAADWDGAPELKGTVRFASRNGLGRFTDDTGMHPQIGRTSWEVIADRPVSWSGEGLPPVGAMVEIRLMGWSIRESAEKFIGVPLRVAASFRMDCGTDMIAVDGGIDLGCEVFRSEMAFPIRTPEQIAAEERSKAIREIQADLDVPLRIAIRAYGKGYRKEAP
ncbi:hypothetical protein CXK97_19500 [Stutzerimonas stutzeri]|nr:hypothetical protein CXK97_19500 [Stutzerimonas stutzeri]